jgi:hypothetical protein
MGGLATNVRVISALRRLAELSDKTGLRNYNLSNLVNGTGHETVLQTFRVVVPVSRRCRWLFELLLRHQDIRV